MAEVLIAGDNSLKRFVVSRALGRKGHRAHGVRNGAEALEALENRDYDLLLLDLSMPVLGGAATAEIIRASRKRYAAIPILALTARDAAGDQTPLQAAGVDGFLPKPLDVRQLLAWIEQLLARRAA